LKDRRLLSRGVRPDADMEKHATLAFAPELATQAWDKVVEIVTLVGNSPMVLTGWPTAVSFVGSVGQIENIDMVFEPGLTAMRFCFLLAKRAVFSIPQLDWMLS
jgi:hypothetical protein